MEKAQVIVVLFQKKIENLAILLCELTVSELGIGNSLPIGVVWRLGVCILLAVKCLRMFHYQVKPKIRFHLFHDMGELGGDDALNGRVVTTKRKEEIYDPLTDSDLFALFVDVLVGWEEEKNLCVGVVFVLRLRHCRL